MSARKSPATAPATPPLLEPVPADAPSSAEAAVARRPHLLGHGLGLALLAWAATTAVGLVQFPRVGVPRPVYGWLLYAWVLLLRRGLGWGSLLVPVALGLAGVAALMWAARRPLRVRWGRVLAWEVALAAWLAWMSLQFGHSLARVDQGLDGGALGWGLAEILLAIAPRAVWQGVLPVVCSLALTVALGWLPAWWARALAWARRVAPVEPASGPAPSGVAVEEDTTPAPSRPRPKRRTRPKVPIPAELKARLKTRTPAPAEPVPPKPRDQRLPPLTLLKPEKARRADEKHIHLTAALIEQTLAEFDIPAKVVGVQVGPTVVQYALEPGYMEKNGERQKVRVAQIVALRRDLALALATDRLRIQAPVPGRPYIGIEVPNTRATLVRLRPLLESEAFARLNAPLALALGRDVSGEPLVADLAAMPHLLIAGTTGSGKSVFLRAMALNLVLNNTPEDLRLILLDPKRVELSRFAGLPHVLGQVETDLERIQAALQWVVGEMQRRYALFEKARARHIGGYNRKMARRGQPGLPYIVVIIDELADLMMQAPESTETALVRLAQMARATGIHLMVATQRPSTDVVTGLIKANFPARLAFAVASAVDSRVILDAPGAEHLLGRGDMLFAPPDAPAPIRAQGVWVDDEEVQRVVAFWQQQADADKAVAPASGADRVPWDAVLQRQHAGPRWDPLLERAAEVVLKAGRAHTSLLQRRLRIGYPRAARLMEQLEEVGVVGPPKAGGKEREILWDPQVPFRLVDETPGEPDPEPRAAGSPE